MRWLFSISLKFKNLTIMGFREPIIRSSSLKSSSSFRCKSINTQEIQDNSVPSRPLWECASSCVKSSKCEIELLLVIHLSKILSQEKSNVINLMLYLIRPHKQLEENLIEQDQEELWARTCSLTAQQQSSTRKFNATWILKIFTKIRIMLKETSLDTKYFKWKRKLIIR